MKSRDNNTLALKIFVQHCGGEKLCKTLYSSDANLDKPLKHTRKFFAQESCTRKVSATQLAQEIPGHQKNLNMQSVQPPQSPSIP